MAEFVESFETRTEAIMCFRRMTKSQLYILKDKLEDLQESHPSVKGTGLMLYFLETVINEI